MRRRHLTSRIPKNESGKPENETAGLSGELLIGDDFLVARLGLGSMRLTGKGIWGEPADRSEAIEPTILRKKIEDVREAGAPMSILSGTSRDRVR